MSEVVVTGEVILTTGEVKGESVTITSESKGDGACYIGASSGVVSSWFVRSDGSVDRFRSGRITQRVQPPEGTRYVAVTAGIHANYFLRSDGIVDRLVSGSSPAGIQPENFPKVTYTAVSNSSGPCYLLRSDGKVDLVRRGAVVQTLDGPYKQLGAGTDVSWLLKADGGVDKIFGSGKVAHTFYSPDATSAYTAIASSCVSAKNDKGGGGPTSMYFIRADGKVDRVNNVQITYDIHSTMVPPSSVQYVAVSCQDTSSYLLRSDGAIDRTTGGGKVTNTINPPPNGRYVAVSAGQWASYFVRNDGQIDRTTGWGVLSSTIKPDTPVAEHSGKACLIM